MALLEGIEPGTMVTVKVVKVVTNAAAKKTIERVMMKSAAMREEQNRLEKVRIAGQWQHQRGGRPWTVRVPKQHPVKVNVGDTHTVLATFDVLQDLNSVKQFIEVEPAK